MLYISRLTRRRPNLCSHNNLKQHVLKYLQVLWKDFPVQVWGKYFCDKVKKYTETLKSKRNSRSSPPPFVPLTPIKPRAET